VDGSPNEPFRLAFRFEGQRDNAPTARVPAPAVLIEPVLANASLMLVGELIDRPQSHQPTTVTFVMSEGIPESRELQLLSRRLRDEIGRQSKISFDVVDDCAYPFLTSAEIQTLRFKYQGFTAKQIARVRGCSPRTVEKHIENVYQKTAAGKLTPDMLRLMETCFYVLLSEPRGQLNSRAPDNTRTTSLL
jgi:hypothetical protein